MEVKVARTAGFCMGVKRAMEKALATAEGAKGPVYTYGPLIHNPQAVEALAARGIRDILASPGATRGTVVIRAHGVPTDVVNSLEARGLDVVDATCPHVVASQHRIEQAAAQGWTIVIAGDKDHAEVEGLRSRAGPRCLVVSTPEEARAVELAEPACLLAQTTFSEETYEAIADVLRQRLPGIEVVQSICRSTSRRQQEALRLAREVEAMVVVGGRQSANSRRLAEICRLSSKPTFHVESAAELDPQALAGLRVVGLTAGASTPNWVTRSVLQALEDMTAPQPKARWLWWRVAAVLTRSNLYSALATVALAYACCQLMGIASPKALFLLSAFCYVFAITTLNRLALGEGAGELATPRVAFYQRHAGALLAVSMLFAAGSIASLALARGRTPLILLLVAYAMGVAYSVRLVPQRWRRGLRIARLKDIPASKDVFIAIGWAVVCALIPWVGHGCRRPLGFAAAAAFALLLTFVKANLVDLRDMQEDRLLGRETLPILLGVRRTRLLMVGLALALAAALAAAAFPGWATPLAWLLTACPVCLLAQVAWVPHASDVGCTLIADGILLLAGALALAWHVLPLH